jgi:transcription initiation factor TFIID TATA-box-binding protein
MIANIVSCACLNVSIDLSRLASETQYEASYRPEIIKQVVLRLPKACILVYHNGKVVCNGVKSIDETLAALEALTEELKRLGHQQVFLSDNRIVNMIANSRLESSIDLKELSNNYDGVMYEPEIFPGASFKLPSGININAFTTGKFYCTGAKSIEQAEESLQTADNIE